MTVRSTIIALARQQRRNNVTAEAIVWRALRGRRSEGFKFRRQVQSAPISLILYVSRKD
jgi:very-short-patch-repair endonuclease